MCEMIMNRLFREWPGMRRRMAINLYWIILLAPTLLLTITNVTGIQLTEIAVPEVADTKGAVNLTCTYHMGKHKLNSVKWYKDGMEFFRYAPLMTPTILTFPVVGISLLTKQTYICNSHTCTISLEQLDVNTSGSYRCEVSGDAPEFKLDSQTANMTIGVLPKHDPIITGLAEEYDDGDLVIVNCTTDMSSPPASVTWYLNGELANNDYHTVQSEETTEENGMHLAVRTRELHFHVDRYLHFGVDRHTLELRCSAQLDGVSLATLVQHQPPRETIKFVSLRQDERSNPPLMTFLPKSASRSSSPSQIHLLISLQMVLLSVVIVPVIFATTATSPFQHDGQQLS